MITYEDVVRISNPITSRSLISIQKTPGCFSAYCQVIFENILSFNSIFDEEGMAQCLINYIVLDSEIVHLMDGDCSVVGMMDSIASNIGFSHSSS